MRKETWEGQVRSRRKKQKVWLCRPYSWWKAFAQITSLHSVGLLGWVKVLQAQATIAQAGNKKEKKEKGSPTWIRHLHRGDQSQTPQEKQINQNANCLWVIAEIFIEPFPTSASLPGRQHHRRNLYHWHPLLPPNKHSFPSQKHNEGSKRDQPGCQSGLVITWGRRNVQPGTCSQETR